MLSTMNCENKVKIIGWIEEFKATRIEEVKTISSTNFNIFLSESI